MDNNYLIDFTNFPPVYGNTITLPYNTLLYRSYDIKYDPVSDYPCYFGSEETASGYLASGNRKLGIFNLSQQITLLDMRYFKVILQSIINSRNKDTKEIFDAIATVTLAYGLCSYEKQIELIKQRYCKDKTIEPALKNMIQLISKVKNMKGFNPLEPEGVRIGETTNDGIAISFIKDIFKHRVDGIISPKMFSPFHIEKQNYLSAEIVIFDPQKSGLQLLPNKPLTIQKLNIENILPKNIYQYQYVDKNKDIVMKSKIIGGGGIDPEKLDRNYFFDQIQSGNKEFIKLYKKATKLSKKFIHYPCSSPDYIYLDQPTINIDGAT
jgi:hypothetical protein